MKTSRPSSLFTRFAKWSARTAGRPGTFVIAVCVLLAWALCGPFFGFNDTWQLLINTSTTIVTFLMVFVIQSTQNRDTEAMQVKLDELIRTHIGAQNALLDLEEMEEEELDRIHATYEKLAQKARDEIQRKRRSLSPKD
ncbi:MAG: low affinity iron permease family protein [Terrimicrobiaceae bacterium]|nr:low affinity iron permease family protein [Terrimicrobiaceae bacterium]